MSFTHKEPLQSKFAVMPAPKDIEALVRAEHPDPFAILGPHEDEAGGQVIRAFLPAAPSATNSGKKCSSVGWLRAACGACVA